MKRKYFWLLAFIIISIINFSACGSKGKSSKNNLEDISDSITFKELALPDVPKSITSPKDRAEYILLNFWNDMNFKDTLYSHNMDFMERNFVNFLSLFPHAQLDALHPATKKLLQASLKDEKAFDIIQDLAEKYLADAGSPQRNEDFYIVFLQETLNLKKLSKDKKMRPEAQLKIVMKNRPGDKATNFSYLTRQGEHSTLNNTPAKNFLLLIFYDPECSHCTDILEDLNHSSIINQLFESGELTILAVYTEGKKDIWDKNKESMPKNWIVSIDESNIVDNSLYDLPAMPIIYLLDSNKKVILKDPSTNDLEEYLIMN